MTKRMLDNSMQVTMEQALDDEGVAQTVNFGTADTAEAMKAFVREARAEVRRSLTSSALPRSVAWRREAGGFGRDRGR